MTLLKTLKVMYFRIFSPFFHDHFVQDISLISMFPIDFTEHNRITTVCVEKSGSFATLWVYCPKQGLHSDQI